MALAGGGPDDHVRAFMRGNLTGVSSQSRQEMRWLTFWLLQRRWEWRQIGERQAIGEGLGLGIDTERLGGWGGTVSTRSETTLSSCFLVVPESTLFQGQKFTSREVDAITGGEAIKAGCCVGTMSA